MHYPAFATYNTPSKTVLKTDAIRRDVNRAAKIEDRRPFLSILLRTLIPNRSINIVFISLVKSSLIYRLSSLRGNSVKVIQIKIIRQRFRLT